LCAALDALRFGDGIEEEKSRRNNSQNYEDSLFLFPGSELMH